MLIKFNLNLKQLRWVKRFENRQTVSRIRKPFLEIFLFQSGNCVSQSKHTVSIMTKLNLTTLMITLSIIFSSTTAVNHNNNIYYVHYVMLVLSFNTETIVKTIPASISNRVPIPVSVAVALFPSLLSITIRNKSYSSYFHHLLEAICKLYVK